MPSITCHFWNAGQGLFSSGKIALPNNKEFVWVYDCGSTKQGNINAAVSDMKQTYPNKVIDLLAISHFDKDHINGLSTLLADRKVKQWLLPYYPLWQRLFIALSFKFPFNSNAFNFCLNPVKFILDNYSASFTEESEIILVPAQQNPEGVRPPENTNNQPFLFQKDVNFENEFDEFYQPSVKLMKPYIPMAIRGVEFVPYNVPLKHLPRKPDDIDKFHKNIEAILHSSDNIKSKKEQLQELYDQNFTKQKRNAISLFLYIGITPINHRKTLSRRPYFKPCKYYDCYYCYYCYDWNNWDNPKKWSPRPSKSALLYTGDAELKEQAQLDNLSTTLGKDRMDNIFAFQVPHHGSKENHFIGLAEQIDPDISIFCADPNHKRYRHPNAQVVRDFLPYTPIFVDKNCGMFFTLN